MGDILTIALVSSVSYQQSYTCLYLPPLSVCRWYALLDHNCLGWTRSGQKESSLCRIRSRPRKFKRHLCAYHLDQLGLLDAVTTWWIGEWITCHPRTSGRHPRQEHFAIGYRPKPFRWVNLLDIWLGILSLLPFQFLHTRSSVRTQYVWWHCQCFSFFVP